MSDYVIMHVEIVQIENKLKNLIRDVKLITLVLQTIVENLSDDIQTKIQNKLEEIEND